MNRLRCINCQTTWPSLPHQQLEHPHNCPACGDELVPGNEATGRATAARHPSLDLHFDQAA